MGLLNGWITAESGDRKLYPFRYFLWGITQELCICIWLHEWIVYLVLNEFEKGHFWIRVYGRNIQKVNLIALVNPRGSLYTLGLVYVNTLLTKEFGLPNALSNIKFSLTTSRKFSFRLVGRVVFSGWCLSLIAKMRHQTASAFCCTGSVFIYFEWITI